MDKSQNGGPAFPVMDAKELDQCPVLISSGMTLRDYFAAAAIAGCIGRGPDFAANAAYQLADAMLKAREASNGTP